MEDNNMAVRGIIVNIDKVNNVNMISVLFSEKQGEDFRYSTQIVPEASVVDAIMAGRVTLYNATVANNKLKGTTGDLKRFSGESKPLVILAEMIKENSDEIIGYRVSTAGGTVRRVRLKELLAHAEKKTKSGLIPFQNAIYIPKTREKTDYIKAYTANGFEKDIIKVKPNKHSAPAKVNIRSNEEAIKKLNRMFNKEQQIELIKGKSAGLNINIYGNRDLTAEQMRIIREGLEQGLPMQLVADPEYAPNSMRIYMADMKYGYDVREYLNPKYTPEQISEVSLGLMEGLDVSKYSDPKNTPERMAETRLRLSHDIWKEEHALPNGKWI